MLTRDAPRVSVGLDGLMMSRKSRQTYDLLLDGRRIWSFRPTDHGSRRWARWFVAWPRDLLPHLRGETTVTVRTATGDVLAETDVRFTPRERRVFVEDAHGHPLVLNTYGRLVRTFESRGAEALVPLMDALESVIAALGEAGVEAFPAYGTLLGAVRSGTVLGHDDDVDVGYVSHHTHPADVIVESFRLQRALAASGFTISRYSGAAFKVEVPADAGVTIGLDVFAGFFYEGKLMLMGEVYEEFETSWIRPMSTVQLEGRTFPAPAVPEKLLEVTYGAGWRVPDPTFTYTTPATTQKLFNDLFRGTRTYRKNWDRRYSGAATRAPDTRDPHQLARFVHRHEEEGSLVVDLGCGRGQDAMFLGRRGHRVVGFDYSPNGFSFLSGVAQRDDLDVAFHTMNILERRHVVAWCGELALIPGPRAIMARHLLDATTDRGRASVWSMANAVLGQHGGRLYLEFMTLSADREPIEYVDELALDLDPDLVAAEAEAAGGRVTWVRELPAEGWERPAQPIPGMDEPRKCRMVVKWAP